MSYRGGRGRGRGGGGPHYFAKQEPVIPFPEGVTLPDIKSVVVEENLVRRSLKLQNYWKASPYYLEDGVSKRGNSDIERYSDRNKVNTTIRRDSLSQILEHKRFPMELTEGSKGWQRQPSRKRVRWNPDSEIQKLDLFEKLEKREGQNEKEEKDKDKEKEKKEGENEDEDEDIENEDSEEEASDDDYLKNVDFDDDEDDFNIEDDGDDEQIY